MKKLLILADDLTGALDTGIQFAKLGISTQVLRYTETTPFAFPDTISVLVIDTETRPRTPEDAYQIVYELCRQAKILDIPYIYKKTDSALRGNIGSELKAVLDGTGEQTLHFVPAFPAAGRTTREGIHFWDNTPIHETAFGTDLFNPITTSSVTELIENQCQVFTQNAVIDSPPSSESCNGIVVWDAQTEEDLKEIASLFQTWMHSKSSDVSQADTKTGLWAGCAGFAAFLPKLLELRGEKKYAVKSASRIAVLCGSLHPVTKEQIDYAKTSGFLELRLTPEQKLFPDYYQTPEGKDFLKKLSSLFRQSNAVLIDTLDRQENETLQFAKNCEIPISSVRNRIAGVLGMIGRYLIEENICDSYFLTGGDTTLGLMEALQCYHLLPVCEIGSGTVLSGLHWKDFSLQIITKSGGLGKKDIFVEAARQIGIEHI